MADWQNVPTTQRHDVLSHWLHSMARNNNVAEVDMRFLLLPLVLLVPLSAMAAESSTGQSSAAAHCESRDLTFESKEIVCTIYAPRSGKARMRRGRASAERHHSGFQVMAITPRSAGSVGCTLCLAAKYSRWQVFVCRTHGPRKKNVMSLASRTSVYGPLTLNALEVQRPLA